MLLDTWCSWMDWCQLYFLCFSSNSYIGVPAVQELLWIYDAAIHWDFLRHNQNSNCCSVFVFCSRTFLLFSVDLPKLEVLLMCKSHCFAKTILSRHSVGSILIILTPMCYEFAKSLMQIHLHICISSQMYKAISPDGAGINYKII